jgi:hypothetical protein
MGELKVMTGGAAGWHPPGKPNYIQLPEPL